MSRALMLRTLFNNECSVCESDKDVCDACFNINGQSCDCKSKLSIILDEINELFDKYMIYRELNNLNELKFIITNKLHISYE